MRKSGKKISEISIKDVKSYFFEERYKIKRIIDSFIDLPSKMFFEMDPVFVVSTGRTGSELLVNLMKKSKVGDIYHEPRPRMIYGSKLIYESNLNIDQKKIIYLNARYDLLKKVYLEKKRFVETNNRNSFFISALNAIFPRAKFIHLVRHPGDFVRSGIRRGYYKDNENDDGRIVPKDTDKYYNNWKVMSDIEKISWLWNETNNFIEEEKNILGKDKFLFVKSEELFSKPQSFNNILKFLGHPSLGKSKIKSIINRPVNMQKKMSFPKWEHWSKKDIKNLKHLTPLAKKYGYWKI